MAVSIYFNMKMEEIAKTITRKDGKEITLTFGERRILRKLHELNELWKEHGENLTLLNGDELIYLAKEEDRLLCWNDSIGSFSGIKATGGDPLTFAEEEI